MQSFHGTSNSSAQALALGTVNTARGGGELGRGFYTGEHLHNAKTWAFHVSGDKRKNVVEFATPDIAIDALNWHLLDHGSAALFRHSLKVRGLTRSFLFGVDFVWAPIVGSERVSGDQYKWESPTAEQLLNGSQTRRTVR